MNPLRVLHVYRTYFPDPPGGLQEAIRQIAKATKAQAVESRIFTLSPDPQPAEIVREEGTVVRGKSWVAPASCDLGGIQSMRQYQALAQWADVIHFHFPWPFADLLRVFGDETKPAVMTYHSDVVRQKWLGNLYRPLMNRMLRSMSAIVATSPDYIPSSPILRALDRPERVRVIPLGIEDYADTGASVSLDQAFWRERFSLGIDEPFFLSLGVLRYYKGLHTLIDAAPRINAKIVIAGSGPEMGGLKDQAERVGAKNVIFAGQVSDPEKVALIERCRGLLFPSHLRSEAFGMVLIEAAMFSKPSVCCSIGSGTSYVNQDQVTGFVVPPESSAAFADAATTLLNDPARAAQMGAAARIRYESLFSGPALGRAYRSLYDDVLGRRV